MKEENITISGKLGFFFLADVLQLLGSNKKSGVLNLELKKKKSAIIFAEGTIVYASGTKTELKLGSLLINRRLISKEKLNKYLKISKIKNIRLGKTLVDESIISSETLESVLEKQIEEILYDLFFWEVGFFKFNETDPDMNRMISAPFNLTHIILEASRRVDEMTVLKSKIPNDNITFILTEMSKKKGISFVSNEWSILNLIDGQRNIESIIDESHIDKFTIYKMLFSLISSGMIKKNN